MANPDRASYFPAIEKKYGLPMSHWFEEQKQIADLKYPEQVAYFRENHGFTQAHASALVLYARGSKSAHRYESVDDYIGQFDEQKQATVRAIFEAITSKYPKLELVMAWNQPMLRVDGKYVFGLSVHTQHILIAPWGGMEAFLPRLGDYEVNKKTIKVPVDWKVDKKLLRDMAAARIAQIAEETS